MSRRNLARIGTDGTVAGPGGDQMTSTILAYTANVPTLQSVQVIPTPGTEWLYTVPAGHWVRLAGGATTFTTNATASNRYPGIQMFNNVGQNLGQFSPSQGIFTAGITNGPHTYARTPKWVQAGLFTPGISDGAVGMPAFILPAGWSFGSFTVGLISAADGGGLKDTYGTVNLLLQVWTTSPVLSVPGPIL